LAGALSPIVLSGLSDGRCDVEALGLKLRLHPKDNLQEKRLFVTPQCFDPEELETVEAFMSKGQKTFVDIGSKAGVYALIAARAGGPSARVIAIEPQAEMRRRILFNARQNELYTIEVTGVALSNFEGEDIKRMVNETVGRTNRSNESVRVTTLPNLMTEMKFDRLDAIKIDAGEGDLPILSALFKQTDPNVWPKLMILGRSDLTQHEGADATTLAQTKGYYVKSRTRMNVVLVR
jgi:FkbM family methyltransferase